MSVRIELDRLLEVAEQLGTVPMLLTTDQDARPRASAVTLTWEGDVATVRAGHRSVSNAAARPLVSLLWPAPPGERFALLVDGEVTAIHPDPPGEDDAAGAGGGGRAKPGGQVVVQVTSGILHAVDRPHG